jgi:hypothetical protein
MNPTNSPKLTARQGSTVRRALKDGKAVNGYTVQIATDRDGGMSTLIVLAPTDRAAVALARDAGLDARTARPALLRDLEARIAAALSAAPPARSASPAPSRAPVLPSPVVRRATWREWVLTGEVRPAIVAPAVKAAPDCSGNGRQITARNRPGHGAPVAGEYSLGRTAAPARLAHEYRAAGPYVAPRNVTAPVGL